MFGGSARMLVGRSLITLCFMSFTRLACSTGESCRETWKTQMVFDVEGRLKIGKATDVREGACCSGSTPASGSARPLRASPNFRVRLTMNIQTSHVQHSAKEAAVLLSFHGSEIFDLIALVHSSKSLYHDSCRRATERTPPNRHSANETPPASRLQHPSDTEHSKRKTREREDREETKLKLSRR